MESFGMLAEMPSCPNLTTIPAGITYIDFIAAVGVTYNAAKVTQNETWKHGRENNRT
jgi:hypothetical protein